MQPMVTTEILAFSRQQSISDAKLVTRAIFQASSARHVLLEHTETILLSKIHVTCVPQELIRVGRLPSFAHHVLQDHIIQNLGQKSVTCAQKEHIMGWRARWIASPALVGRMAPFLGF